MAMEIDNTELIRLIRSYLAGTLSGDESRNLRVWLDKSPEHEKLLKKIRQEIKISEELPIFCQLDENDAWNHFKQLAAKKERKLRYYQFYKALAYAAAVAIPVVVILSFWIYGNTRSVDKEKSSIILPGWTQATLITANGKTYQLGDGRGGEGVNVALNQQAVQMNDALVYDTTRIASSVEEFNELSIPRGGEFKIVLSDGTLVYLNSATSLKYPVAFSSKERRVFLSGEAYFKVAKDSVRPFYVVTDGLQMRVYGTEFNVNTRGGNCIRTVLVEGHVGVRMKSAEKEVMMNPGEIADYNRELKSLIVKPVDVRPYVAWKNGYFAFENETLEQIMETLSLWYNVDVFFQSESLKDFVFTGFVRKYEQIDSILVAIRDVTGVSYSINNRTVVLSR